MPDENKTVDIDTSGPGADVEIETPKPENEVFNETSNEDSSESTDSIKEPVEPTTIQTSETETTEEVVDDKKKELEDYSDGVKRRIAKLTKKMREAERREEAAVSYAKTVLQEQESLKGRLSKLDTGYVSEMENRIKSSIEAVSAKLIKAREDGDIQAEIAATREISRLGYEEAKLSEIKSKEVKPVEQEIRQPVATPRQQQEEVAPVNPDPQAQEWANKNNWFGKDEAMTFTAFSLHKKLTEDEGYDPQSEEYYVEIDRRIKLEFPHKFGNTNNSSTNKPTQVVASAHRSSKPGRKTVRLTPSQVAIAKKLGVPLEEYAKQLNITKEV